MSIGYFQVKETTPLPSCPIIRLGIIFFSDGKLSQSVGFVFQDDAGGHICGACPNRSRWPTAIMRVPII